MTAAASNTPVIVPAGGMAGTEALLLAWTKQPGEPVEVGEIIAEVETDKATMEIEAPASGVLVALHYEPGTMVPLGVAIAEIGSASDTSSTPEALSGATGASISASDRTTAKGNGSQPRLQAAQLAPLREPPLKKTRKRKGGTAPRNPLEQLRDPESTHGGAVDIGGTPTDQLPEWLEAMLVIREFEEACEPVSRAGKIPGGMHSSAGQEATAVGPARALASHDIVTSSHRSHHTSLAKGVPPGEVMAELYGKADGCVGGRGGHMHLASFDRGLWGSNGIVGGGLGLGLGIALAAKLSDLDQVCVAYFGDGGANTGRVWEAINLASLWKLPLIAICENNLYAVETFIGTATAAESIAVRASGFGLPAEQVDGQDVCAMYRAVKVARERAVSGDGPTFIEALTFRYRGHNTGDPERYRTKKEVDGWRSTRDPIERLRLSLAEHQLLSQVEYDGLVTRARDTATAAVASAESAPWPDPKTALDDVLSGWLH